MRMQQTIGVFAAGVFLISALAMNASCESAVDPSSPQIANYSQPTTVLVDPPLINLGFLEPRSTITRNFRLSNTSKVPITIDSVAPSCTCTTLDVAGKVIPALGSLEVPVTMKVAASTGIKSASVTLTFSDRSTPAKLTMSGEIAYQVRATCKDVVENVRVPFINLFDDPQRPKDVPPPPMAGTLKVISIDQKPFRILSVMNQPPVFAGFDPAKDPPETSYELVYDFSKVPCERMPPYLIIETDHPQAPVIDMRIRHACTKISPQLPFGEYRSNLGAVTTGKEQPFEFELKHSQGWKVISTTSKDPQFTVKLVGQTADADNAMISLMISVNASANGIVLAPVTMTAMDPTGATKSSDFWVYFKAVPAASAAAASAPAASGASAASQKAGS